MDKGQSVVIGTNKNRTDKMMLCTFANWSVRPRLGRVSVVAGCSKQRRNVPPPPPREAHENHRVFESVPQRSHVSSAEVSDAFDICHVVENDAHRQACYLVFGLDEANVERYWPAVAGWDRHLDACVS